MARLVADYVGLVPYGVVGRIADALADAGMLDAAMVSRITAVAGDPALRHETMRLLERWSAFGGADPARLAFMLLGAAEVVRLRGESEGAELVWTGPTDPRTAFRRTDEAMLEVVRHANGVLTLVTFAAYRVPDVRVAIEAALTRGVEVRFVGETERASDGQLRFDASLALGASLSSRVRCFEWPRDLRTEARPGVLGRLHAKCVLADDSHLLVSSANLTESALGSNIEMGVLLSGGPLPKLAARHFEDLIRSGQFRQVR